MSKYTFLGLFFTVLVVIMGGLTVNHMSSVNSMQDIDVGLESVALGLMRDSDGDDYGVRAQDLIAELTAEVAEKQSNTDNVISVSYKLFGKTGNLLDYNTAVNSNDLVYAVQYKVDLYKENSTESNSNGKLVLKEGTPIQSSTENKISLKLN